MFQKSSLIILGVVPFLGATASVPIPQSFVVPSETPLEMALSPVSLTSTSLPSASLDAPFGVSVQAIETASQSQTWRRLLLLNKANKSDIRHADFFIGQANITDDSDQSIDPKTEMIATLKAWQAYLEQGDDKVCRFPARLHWLKTTFNIDKPLPVCQEFDKWFATMQPKALSLSFADEHPNNLASGFGHVLIKLDTQNQTMAVNYTPNIGKDSDAVAAYKSLTGGYAGVMEVLPFDKKRQDYLVKDERDMWLYRLDLTQDELNQIMRHVWEVKDMARPYYLTSDNCATEILRLIDVVRADVSLQAQSGKITAPTQIVRILDKANLLASSEFLPSVASTEQALLNTQKLDKPILLSNNPLTSQGDPRLSSPIGRFGLGLDVVDNHDNSDSAVSVSYRAAYHDLLDRSKGVRQYLGLTLGEVAVKVDDDVKLDKAVLISQRSFNPVNSAKAYNGKASGMHIMLKRIDDGFDEQISSNHLVGHVSLEQGKSWVLGKADDSSGDLPKMLCYGFGMGAMEVGHITKGYRVGVGANLGCTYQQDNWRSLVQFELPYWYHAGSHSDAGYFAPKASLGVQYDLTYRDAVRVQASYQKIHDDSTRSLNVAYHRYF